MKRIFLMLATLIMVAACADKRPETIYLGGTIYTGVEGQPTAEAVGVIGARIVYVGDADTILKDTRAGVKLVNLQNAVMYPGFIDGHAHLEGVGQRALDFSLDGVASLEAMVARVADEVEGKPPGMPVVGRGWIETHWPEGRFPSRDDLDDVSDENPVVLIRADGHALVANSLALEAAGINIDTKDPAGGAIERDEAGRATGMLIDNAMSLIPFGPADSSEEAVVSRLIKGAEIYAASGWTGMHNMSVPVEQVKLMETASVQGLLPLRVYNMLNPDGFDLLAEQGGAISPGALIETHGVKIYMDGALGSRGAALKAPYADRPDQSGLLLRDKDETLDLMTRALKNNIRLSIHAIGDKANAMALDWIEEAMEEADPGADPRWRIEHAQVISPEDFPRFAELGVIASMQPSHAIGDLHFAKDRLGEERLEGAYAWRSLIDAGAVIAGGSDAPVEKGDPRIEFYAAITRKDLNGFSADYWHPEQAVSREEALKMFTSWPAHAAFREHELGSIEVGKFADFSVFDTDFMTAPPEDILEAETIMTVIGGAQVWPRVDSVR